MRQPGAWVLALGFALGGCPSSSEVSPSGSDSDGSSDGTETAGATTGSTTPGTTQDGESMGSHSTSSATHSDASTGGGTTADPVDSSTSEDGSSSGGDSATGTPIACPTQQSPCLDCVGATCCPEWMACATDEACGCWLECFGTGAGFDACYGLCGLPGEAALSLINCGTQCSDLCSEA